MKDCAEVNLWFYEHSNKSGIFNLGTGMARRFNEMATEIVKWHEKNSGIRGTIEYIDFPEHLKGSYQSFTESDNTALLEAGYGKLFLSLEEGIEQYLSELNYN